MNEHEQSAYHYKAKPLQPLSQFGRQQHFYTGKLYSLALVKYTFRFTHCCFFPFF